MNNKKRKWKKEIITLNYTKNEANKWITKENKRWGDNYKKIKTESK